MPELPEVETILQGIKPFVILQTISNIDIYQNKLRWKIPSNLNSKLKNQTILQLSRRGKYLLFTTQTGTLIIHLGMSGKLFIKPKQHALQKHEHAVFTLNDEHSLSYVDPRRFGAILWTENDPLKHKLLKDLGPEPFSDDFNAEYLYELSKRHKCPIKQLIMNSKIVTGVGNIYANEALFQAEIFPGSVANTITKKQFYTLVEKIKKVLKKAIEKNGTTIHDFATSNGKPGDFQNELKVYGRTNLPCKECKTLIKEIRIGQRSTFYCPKCQFKTNDLY